ncbi:MAG: 4-hydroxy-tetrahydrodipicolinate synthase [Chlamydiae bacterium]|nr:4-hydroxy-tetrahydrodipicolinate synthase [Chlamydiota bacterium]
MFSGSIVPLITPFQSDFSIDFDSLENLIQWHIAEGTDGLIIAGTTGESVSLSYEEKVQLFHFSVKKTKKKIPIIASTGLSDTASTVKLTEEAKKIGVDGAIIINPYYTRPTEEGCYLHFKEIAKIGLPWIFYYHPGRTGLKLSVSTISKICEIPGIVGIKDSSGDFFFSIDLLQSVEVPLFCGEDLFTFALMASGFKGTISASANVIPKEWKEWIELLMEENFLEAKQLFRRFYFLCKTLFLEPNPQGVKYALHVLGKCKPHLRLPLCTASVKTQKQIEELVANFYNLRISS